MPFQAKCSDCGQIVEITNPVHRWYVPQKEQSPDRIPQRGKGLEGTKKEYGVAFYKTHRSPTGRGCHGSNTQVPEIEMRGRTWAER